MRKAILAAIIASTAIGGFAVAQPAPPPAPPGSPDAKPPVTRAEASSRAAALFDRMDANHDGKLDQADRAARTTAMFDRIDANHDGALSRDEFAAAHQRMGREGPGSAKGPGAMGPGAADRTPITRDAFVAGALKRFDAADANHDGTVTREERRAAFMAMRKAHGGRLGGKMPALPDGDMPPPPPPAG